MCPSSGEAETPQSGGRRLLVCLPAHGQTGGKGAPWGARATLASRLAVCYPPVTWDTIDRGARIVARTGPGKQSAQPQAEGHRRAATTRGAATGGAPCPPLAGGRNRPEPLPPLDSNRYRIPAARGAAAGGRKGGIVKGGKGRSALGDAPRWRTADQRPRTPAEEGAVRARARR